MQQKQFNKRSALRFTHFSRKGYALFSVLGREVLVGVLAVSTLTYAKAEGISTSTERSTESTEHEEVKLDEVIVTGSRAPLTLSQSAQIVTVVTRDDIARAAAESINDVLKLVPGVDVR
ncbi:MAG: TonB-dependent receptor plug domain-containing protein, partial [Prevotella sp.]